MDLFRKKEINGATDNNDYFRQCLSAFDLLLALNIHLAQNQKVNQRARLLKINFKKLGVVGIAVPL